MNTLTEVDILLVTVEEAEKYSGDLFSKYEFIQYKDDSLISMIGSIEKCFNIFKSSMKRLNISIDIPVYKIQKGYLQILKKRKVSNKINLYKPIKKYREKVINNDDIMDIIINLNNCKDVLEFIDKI